MELNIKKGFGIRNSLQIKSVNNKIVIFAPNGSGKTSIRKLFENTEKAEFENFGIEKDGTADSLVVDNLNMTLLNKKKY